MEESIAELKERYVDAKGRGMERAEMVESCKMLKWSDYTEGEKLTVPTSMQYDTAKPEKSSTDMGFEIGQFAGQSRMTNEHRTEQGYEDDRDMRDQSHDRAYGKKLMFSKLLAEACSA